MKLKDLKYGFLISASTLFGGSSLSLYAQTNNATSQKIETVSNYKKQFLESIDAHHDKISVDFMVDSVADKVSHGDLITDVNVIELLAYLEPDNEDYQSYLANKHVVAHEMWHRICLMKGVLEQPMSATQFRTGLDNFEMTASLLPVLTFRDDYIHATPKERKELMKSPDPKIEMYVQAIKHDIVRPLSLDKKDFDFEMQFIAVMVSNFWKNNMAESYADYHNTLTLQSNRKEFKTPVYDDNFNHDIKIMSTIGGIDFSKYYNVNEANTTGIKFPLSEKADTVVLNKRLNTPDYETWVNKKSKLKRYSKQNVEIPNFAGDILVKEREARPYDKRVQPCTIAPYATGYKTYPRATTFFKTAIEVKKQDKTYKFYPNGSLDEISPDKNKSAGTANVITYNIDGSYEKGQLFQGRKNGAFTYYDKNNRPISTCTFKNGRPQDGMMFGVFQQKRFYYTYQNGKLLNVECRNFEGKKLSACLMNEEMPLSGMMPKDVRFSDMMFDVYEKSEKIATVILNDDAKTAERIVKKENTVKIERFYEDGTPHYAAKITPFKKMEILYDKQAKPVVMRNKINQKLYLKGNLEKLKQEIRLSPLEICDKKLILNHLADWLKNDDSKVISPKGHILAELPFVYESKSGTTPYVAALKENISHLPLVDKTTPVLGQIRKETKKTDVKPALKNNTVHVPHHNKQKTNTFSYNQEIRMLQVAKPGVAFYPDVMQKASSPRVIKTDVFAPRVAEASALSATKAFDKNSVLKPTEAMIVFHPVSEQIQVQSAPALSSLTSDVTHEKAGIINKVISLFISREEAEQSLPLQQESPVLDVAYNVSQNRKLPRFLWRKFSFSPRALTTSASGQSNHFTLFNKKARLSRLSLKPTRGKKFTFLTKKSRFQKRFRLTSSKKVLGMLKLRALSGQRRG